MDCPNCHQAIEPGALFCGNCGHQLSSAKPAYYPGVNVPSYAIAQPWQQKGEVKALLSILLGVCGLVGAQFIAIAGIILGLAGLVTGSLSRKSVRRSWSSAGLMLSGLAVFAGLAVWVYNVQQDTHVNKKAITNSATAPIVLANHLSTPCYSIDFVQQMHVSNNANSCDMSASDSQTFDDSSDAYKVSSSQTQISSIDYFNTTAKQAIEKDVQKNLPGFSIKRKQITTFADSPAYEISLIDETKNVAVVEAAVFHKSKTGDNIFVLVHAQIGQTADLQLLESQWQWK